MKDTDRHLHPKITVYMTKAEIAAIDAYCERQTHRPTRSEVIRDAIRLLISKSQKQK